MDRDTMMFTMPSRLSWKLLLAIMPLVVAAVTVIVWLQYAAARRQLLGAITHEMNRIAREEASDIDRQIDQSSHDVQTLSETPLIADYYRNVDYSLLDEADTYRKELQGYLARFFRRSGEYAALIYLDRRGREICRVSAPAGALKFPAADFAAAAKTPVGVVWISPVEEMPGGTVLWYAKPVRDELGSVKGMLVFGYDLARLRGKLGRIDVGKRGTAYIVLPSGGRIEGRPPVVDGESISAAFAIERVPWHVVVEAPLEDFLGPLRSVRNVATGAALSGLGLLIAILLLVVRSVTRPIVVLVAAARAIGAGDLTRRIRRVGTDELGTLARAFNEMAERLEANQSKQKKLQSQLIQAEKLSAVGLLISAVAHELNNPLAAVSAYAQIVLMDDCPPQLREDLMSIRQNALRCQKVVDNLLFFVRQSGHERRKTDINAAVRSAVNLLRYRLKNKEDVHVSQKFAPDLPPVMGDFQEFVQVMVNLIANACDAMEGLPRTGKRLILRTRAANGRTIVEVEDNGPGIPTEIQGRIFEPFFTTKGPGKGTGLGLSICREIVNHHGGSISVDGRPGRGSIFRLDLPAASGAELAADEEAPALPSLPPVPGRRVLVADDEESIATAIARMLREDGDQVRVVMNGADALRLLKDEKFDLVISDIEMQEAKGQDLHSALLGPDGRLSSPMLFITGDVLNPEVVSFLADSGCAFLAKPFDILELRQHARRMLSGAALPARH
jgi:signal transduction histidine kinase